MHARYQGTCAACGQPIRLGDLIAPAPGRRDGYIHATCGKGE